MMERLFRALPVFLAILFSLGALFPLSAEAALIEIPMEDYHYQRALFHLITGDYFSSYSMAEDALSGADEEKNKFILMEMLSDQKRLNLIEDYPQFSAKEKQTTDPSETLWLLDSLHRSGAYRSLLSAGPQVAGPSTANYFVGLGHLRLGRHREASLFFSKVHKDDPFYPFARVAIAQTDVARGDFESAEDELRYVLALKGGGGEFIDRVRILLGQVLFEEGLYSDAVAEFSKVPEASYLFRDALIASAWGLVKRGSYEEAIAALGKAKSVGAHDTKEWERLIMLSYSHANLGRIAEAAAYFNEFSDSMNAAENWFEALVEDASARGVYAGYLLGRDVRPLSAKERYYLPVFAGDSGVRELLARHRVLSSIKSAFLEKEREVGEEETYIKNMISAMEGIPDRAGTEAETIKNTVFVMDERLKRSETSRAVIQNMPFFTGALKRIYDRWETVLKRKLNDNEKNVIRLILYEGSEATECPEPSVACLIVHIIFSADERLLREGDDPQNLLDATEVLEKISADLANIRRGEPMEYEKDIALLKGIARRKAENGKAALKRLEEMRARIKAAAGEAETGMEVNAAELDGYMKGRLEQTRYEMAEFSGKADVLKKIISQRKGEAKARIDEGR